MCINETIEKQIKYPSNIKLKIDIINDIKYKNFINSRKKKMQEEIKDIIIDKYREKIITQQNEIEQLKKKLDEAIRSSLIILKNSINSKTNINDLPPKIPKQKLKNEILNLDNKNDIIVHMLNRNNNKYLSYSTISSDNVKLKKNNTQLNELKEECKKKTPDEKNNLSLSNSRIKINKYEVITPKRIKIETLNKPKSISKSKSKSKNKKEKESNRHTINNIDINDLNTYYLKEYNKKDFKKIEEIKSKLLNNNLPPELNKNNPINQKNKNNNSNNAYNKSYSQNNNKKLKKQNLVNKENNYSYGQNNLKKVFNSPKNIQTQFFNEKNKCFNEYYINKTKIPKNGFDDNKIVMENNYLYTNPTYNTKNIIHRNININNNNNKIYINTDNNIDNIYLRNINSIKGINKHFKTQTNFYQHKIINRGNNQLSLNFKDFMLTAPPHEYN